MAAAITRTTTHVASADELEISEGGWIKSHYSSPNGNCVEMAMVNPDIVAIRNSRDPHGVALVFTRMEIRAFAEGCETGDFDQILGILKG